MIFLHAMQVELGMPKKALLMKLLWVGLFICIVNATANFFSWYSTIWWFDMPMHFLGGYFIGLLVLLLVLFSNFGNGIKKDTVYEYILFLLLGVLSISILWEVFEVVMDTYTTKLGFNILDTLSDLFFDTAGALLALRTLLFYKKEVEGREEIQYTLNNDSNRKVS